MTEPPSGVRVTLDDGSTIDCDMIYAGEDGGIAIWEANPRERFDGRRVRRLQADRLPARTAISLDHWTMPI
jgi:hypothetical protein